MAQEAEAPRSATAETWMQLALQEARNAIDEGEVPVGAVFVKHTRLSPSSFDLSSGDVVARGHNLTNQTRNVCHFFTLICPRNSITDW